jgi:hypothetical protein
MKQDELAWRTSGLTVHRQIYKSSRNKYFKSIRKFFDEQFKEELVAADHPRLLWSKFIDLYCVSILRFCKRILVDLKI